jgi:hypothetical protein
MKWRRFSLLRQAIIASVVMCAVATSAKAELDITINNTTLGTQLYTGNITGLAASYSSNGYTINNITITQPTTLGSAIGQGIQVAATITNTTGLVTSDTFQFILTSTNNSTSPNLSGLYGAIAGIGASQFLLSQSAILPGSTFGSGTITTNASYTGYLGGVQNDAKGPLQSGTTAVGTNTTALGFTNQSTSFNLEAVTAEAALNGGAGSTTQFTSTAFLALPEPNGMVAFMAGVPFLFGALRMVRRRAPVSVENAIA